MHADGNSTPNHIKLNNTDHMKKTISAVTRWLAPHGLMKIAERKRHKARQELLYRRLFAPSSLVFDVGANVGNRVAAFLECGARVLAIEPQPDCIAYLQRSFGSRITVVPAAAGNKSGKLPLRISDRMDTVASLSPEFVRHAETTRRFGNRQWGRTVEVDVVTLDSLIDKYGKPVFIKIDVEGFEFEVLSGLRQPVNALSFEWTPSMPANAIRCVDYLEGLGMRNFQFSFGESMRLTHSTSIGIGGAKELIRALAEESNLFGDIYASVDPIVRAD